MAVSISNHRTPKNMSFFWTKSKLHLSSEQGHQTVTSHYMFYMLRKWPSPNSLLIMRSYACILVLGFFDDHQNWISVVWNQCSGMPSTLCPSPIPQFYNILRKHCFLQLECFHIPRLENGPTDVPLKESSVSELLRLLHLRKLVSRPLSRTDFCWQPDTIRPFQKSVEPCRLESRWQDSVGHPCLIFHRLVWGSASTHMSPSDVSILDTTFSRVVITIRSVLPLYIGSYVSNLAAMTNRTVSCCLWWQQW